MTSLGPEQVSAISRLFSSGVVRELARKGKSPLFAKLVRESQLSDFVTKRSRVHTLFDAAFSILKQEAYRHEYVYKAALTEKVLLGKHSLQTASMLTEFRVGECKADVAIFNGTSTVYEVKSERDSLSRLERQLEAYSKVFAKIYVIAGENHVAAVKNSVSDEIGIMKLSNRHQISTLREAVERADRVSPAAIFDSIRIEEAKLILQFLDVSIPKVPNTAVHSVLRELFEKLDPCIAHSGMVTTLKKTRNLLPLSELVDQLPLSLQTAALSVPLRKVDHARLVAAVNTPLMQAMAWA